MSRGITILIFLLMPFYFISGDGMASVDHDELNWIDVTYRAMSMDQKLGQLFMIRAFSKGNKEHEKHIENLIKEEFIGGLCFFQGSPERQVQLTNRYQSLSRIPMLISIDAEWGLGMRFKDKAISFPRQLTLGAIRDNRHIYDMGVEVAHQLKRLGIHINFAPVVDINNNKNNPVINDRSFGEGRKNVSSKAFAYMRGMQDGGIISCAKHFPGHGDTNTDSHYDLPVINHNKTRLDSLELYPFKVLSQHGIKSVMIAHLSVPSLDSRPQMPTTLSRKVVHDILKSDIGFQGLVITDALDMVGVTKHHDKGVLEALALEAGNDILLLSEEVKLAKEHILRFIAEGRISEAQIEQSVKKILRYKYRMGLNAKPFISEENVANDIITARAVGLKGRLYERALTLVRDSHNILPIGHVLNSNFASLSLGVKSMSTFQKRLGSFASIENYHAGLNISQDRKDALVSKLAKKEVIFIGLHNYKKSPKGYYGLGYNIIDLINTLNQRTTVVLVIFGSPYVLQHFDEINSLVAAYESDELSEDFAAQALFGVFGFNGALPINASPKSKMNDGEVRKSNGRLGYVMPEVVGMDGDTLAKMDELAKKMIQTRATPGCQILVAKDGKVVFHKAYGHHTYNKKRKVQLNDVYDLASITKVAATTLALMKLTDEGKFDLNQPLSNYLPELDTTDKSDLLAKDVLAHHARLKGWIPFYESTKNGKKLSDKWYRPSSENGYEIEVCEKVFIKNEYLDTIYERIICSPLREQDNYRYSDLGFYLFDRIIRNSTGLSLDKFCEENFYRDLGLRFAGFNPLKNGIPRALIPPTEKDNYFRSKTVQGYVHDMGAAMMGGVSGHAGLFSNAHDLAIIMQMLLNGGEYGGKTFLSHETISAFTQRHPRSTRRAYGFDMKELNTEKTLNMAEEASSLTFGHLGFTGTATWVDPENDLVYVFLSNRTYPSMKNNKLHKENYRPRFQSIMYQSLINQ